MYLMYVDESGDPGNSPGSSEHYILSGIIMHYQQWTDKLDRLKKFRKYISYKYGLGIEMEIHAVELLRIKKISAYREIRKADRLKILREYATCIPDIFEGCKVINVSINKSGVDLYENIQNLAWEKLMDGYDQYLKKMTNGKGMIFSDEGNEKNIRLLLRKMRIDDDSLSGSHNKNDTRITNIIEDIVYRKSSMSYFIQTVDVIAFLLYKMEYPEGAAKKYNIDRMFSLIEPVLFKDISPAERYGIVRC